MDNVVLFGGGNQVQYVIDIIEKDGKEESDGPAFSSITIGLTHPVTYTLELGNTFP